MLCIVYGVTLFAQNLTVRVEADRLRIAGPQFHFLAARVLERLHNGETVTYELQLTARTDHAGQVLSRVLEKFTFSYDLWEEKLSVTRLDSPTRSASNLSASRAEAWCLDNLSLPVAELSNERQFWVALEYEMEGSKDANKPGGSGLTLEGLIDIFSRRQRDELHVRGVDEAGPFRLADLRKKQVK
jgi:hypothetical protein